MWDYAIEDAYGPWVDFAQAVLRLGLGMSGIPDVAAAIDVASTVLGYEDSQKRLLKSIRDNTELQRAKPFTSGTGFLKEALEMDSGNPARSRFLWSALERLMDARSVARSPEERSVVKFELSVCWLALGDRGQAEKWSTDTITSAHEALESMVARARTGPNVYPRVVDARGQAERPKHWRLWNELTPVLSLANYFLPAMPVSMATYHVLSKRRRRQINEIVRYLPFHNVAEAWNAMLHGAGPPDPVVLGERQLPPDDTYDGWKGTTDYLTCAVVTHASNAAVLKTLERPATHR